MKKKDKESKSSRNTINLNTRTESGFIRSIQGRGSFIKYLEQTDH